MYAGKRKEREAMIADLKQVRRPYEPLWEEVDRSVCPGMLRLQLSEQNRGMRDDWLILNSTADKSFDIQERDALDQHESLSAVAGDRLRRRGDEQLRALRDLLR